MPSRLLTALVLSLALHAMLFSDALKVSVLPAPPRLQAELHPPEQPIDGEPLLKNTLAADPKPVKPPSPAPKATHAAPAIGKAAAKRQVDAAQRKLSQHLYYPPEAVARGIEGEVRLLLTISDDGSISDVSVAASSGHAILDQAAVRAAYAMGRVNWARSREFILPVIFRLE